MGIEGGRLAKRGTAAEPGMAIGSRHGCGIEGHHQIVLPHGCLIRIIMAVPRAGGRATQPPCPAPNEPLETLVSWVEQGIAPAVLPATRAGGGDVEVTRDLGTYPQKLVYQEGDVNLASSLRASRYIVAANKDPIVSTDKSARIVTCSHSY